GTSPASRPVTGVSPSTPGSRCCPTSGPPRRPRSSWSSRPLSSRSWWGRRAVAGRRARQRGQGRRGARRLHAGLLVRADPAAVLRPAAARAAGRRGVRPQPAVHPPAGRPHPGTGARRADQRQLADAGQHPGAPDPAGARGGQLPGRTDRAHDPRAGARHPRRDPRADGALARLPGADGDRHVRDEAGLESGGVRPRPRLRLLARQHVPGRVHLRLARPRQLHGGLGIDARHPRDPRRDLVHRRRVRAGQPGRGPGAGGARPPGPAAMSPPAPAPPGVPGRPPLTAHRGALRLTALRLTALGQAARRDPVIAAGAVIVGLIVAVAVLAPLLAPFPGDAGSAVHPADALQAPSLRHLFGTDQVGRDVFSRVLSGARVSPVIALFVLLIAGLIGVPLGVAAGYFGGVTDEVIMRVTDVFLAFPSLLLALAFAAVVQPATLTSSEGEGEQQ